MHLRYARCAPEMLRYHARTQASEMSESHSKTGHSHCLRGLRSEGGVSLDAGPLGIGGRADAGALRGLARQILADLVGDEGPGTAVRPPERHLTRLGARIPLFW